VPEATNGREEEHGGMSSPTFDPRGVSRRTLLRGGIAALGAAGLASGLSACGNNAFSAGVAGTKLDPKTVTFWNLFGGGDGARLQLMLDQYKKTHGGDKSLQAATFAWGNPYYTKVSLATLGHKPPDVAVSHLTRAKNLASAGLLTEITPELLAKGGLKIEDFDQTVWKAGLIDGKSYTIPLDTHPFVLFYHTGVCKKAGLLGSDGKLKQIQGVDQWEAALTAAKKVTGSYGAVMPTIGDTSASWRWFTTLYSQMGGTPFLADDGTKLTIDDQKALATLTYIQKLTKSGLMPTQADDGSSESAWFAGKAAFFLSGEWEVTTAQTAKVPFSVAPIPQLYDKKAAQADSHTFVLPTMNRDEGQASRAMGFVKNMLDQSMTWAEGGHIPSYLPVKNSASYKKLEPQADYSETASYAVYDAPGWYSGSGSNFEVVVGAEIGLVQQGLSTPKAALDSIHSQLSVYAKTPNPI